jgi:signal transduction histidine kinase
MQTKIAALTAELRRISHFDSPFQSRDEVVEVFKWQIYSFADEFRQNLDKWSNLDAEILEKLRSGQLNYLLHLELVSDLASLLLDEFGQTMESEAIAWAKQILCICQEIRAAINTVLNRDINLRLPSQLDSPVLRQKLSIDFDQSLRKPVADMIDLIEVLLRSDNLNNEQRKDLGYSLKYSKQLHSVLRTARPLILSGNFTALASMSHSYRSPFCGITGHFLNLLELFNEGLKETDLRTLRSLRDYAYTILPMVNNILDASKLIAGIEIPDLSTMSICESLKYSLNLVDTNKTRFPLACISIRMPLQILASTLKTARFEYHCLRYIVDNAFKYAPKGSIIIEAELSDDWLCISIADTGIGIPESEFEYIFEPFTQVGEQKKGLGLGLYLARQYAEKVGGSISVESQLGQGSKFTIKMPVLKTSETQPL